MAAWSCGAGDGVTDAGWVGPAYYARRGGWWADWYTVLHPPYTAWHLGYVVIGASLAPRIDAVRLLGTLLAFLLAVGVAAHALDEIRGRPLGTALSNRALEGAACTALIGAVAIGIASVPALGIGVVVAMIVGVVIVLGYNLELLGGQLHTHWTFALGWGAYPVLVAYFAQTGRITVAAVLAAASAAALSSAQRSLSTPARLLRRHVRDVAVRFTLAAGDRQVNRTDLLRPLEAALRALSWAVCLLATGLILEHWT